MELNTVLTSVCLKLSWSHLGTI